MNGKVILHIGFGHRHNGANLGIDPNNNAPDILGAMLDMAALGASTVDAIYSAHNIEQKNQGQIPIKN